MKKLIVSILALVYIAASTGTSVDIHYCMGKLVDWTFSHSEKSECGKCGMEKKTSPNGCCKDEQKFVKNTVDQKTVSNELQFMQAAAVLPSYADYQATVPQGHAIGFPKAHAPPQGSSPSIYLLHCNFRI